MKKKVMIIISFLACLSAVLVCIIYNLNYKEDTNNGKEYDESILEDIYLDYHACMLLSSGRFIEDIKKMYEPSFEKEGEYYYNIKGDKQLRITVREGGTVKRMYYDYKHRVSHSKYKEIEKCKNIEELQKCVGDVYIFTKETKIYSIFDGECAVLASPFCEICFDNNDICIVNFDKKCKKILDVLYISPMD